MRELSILIIPKSIITFYLFNTGSRLAVSIGVAVPSKNVQIMIVRLSISSQRVSRFTNCADIVTHNHGKGIKPGMKQDYV